MSTINTQYVYLLRKTVTTFLHYKFTLYVCMIFIILWIQIYCMSDKTMLNFSVDRVISNANFMSLYIFCNEHYHLMNK